MNLHALPEVIPATPVPLRATPSRQAAAQDAAAPVEACLLVNSLGVGGAERHMLTLARQFNAQRVAAQLVPVKATGPLLDEARQAGVPVWSPQATSGIDPAAARRLAAHWDESGTEVVLAANMYASLTAWLAACFARRRPRLLSVFHSSPELVRRNVRQRVQLAAYRFALGSFERLVYVSELQRTAWAACGFQPHTAQAHVFNGVSVERYAVPPEPGLRASLGWDARQFVVGVCASLRPEKRIEDLIEAIALLAERGVPVRLLVIGDGLERVRLEAAAQRSLAAGHAVFAGYQSDITSWMHACDAMALVSETEAFSLSVLEAMACARPLVLTRVGGAAEQVRDGVEGFLVAPRAPAQIAERLHAVWSGDRQAMGKRARERAAALFSERRMVEQYEALLTGSNPIPATLQT